MSEDEVAVLIFSTALGALSWGILIWQSIRIGRRFRRSKVCRPFYGSLLGCVGIIGLVLTQYAAGDVRHDPKYIGFYTILGAAWLGLVFRMMSLFGMNYRDEVLERGNCAASWAVAGALAGLTLCYAGGNIGNGPGWWVVLFSAGLATAAFFLFWIILAQWTDLVDTVTIDRDPAAGIRTGGILAALGLILGNAVAGDWHSAEATLHDFVRLGWPSLFLLGIAAFLERQFVPKTDRDISSIMAYGALPGGFYVLIGLCSLMIRISG